MVTCTTAISGYVSLVDRSRTIKSKYSMIICQTVVNSILVPSNHGSLITRGEQVPFVFKHIMRSVEVDDDNELEDDEVVFMIPMNMYVLHFISNERQLLAKCAYKCPTVYDGGTRTSQRISP